MVTQYISELINVLANIRVKTALEFTPQIDNLGYRSKPEPAKWLGVVPSKALRMAPEPAATAAADPWGESPEETEDTDYVPPSEDSEQDEGMEFEIDFEDEDSQDEPTRDVSQTISVTRANFMHLLRRDPGLRAFMQSLHSEADETLLRERRRGYDVPLEKRYPPVPNPAGEELMSSGVFGYSGEYKNSDVQRRKDVAFKVLRRELGLDNVGRNHRERYMAQDMLPSTQPDMIINHDDLCYSGQFSDDGNFFFSCDKNFRVRMYDTSNPYRWKYYKKVVYPGGQWTITDGSLSPDNKFLAYTSITPTVCLAATDPENQEDPHYLDFSAHSHFGIWSIRYSGDGRELLAGTSNKSVIVYDIETRQPLLNFQAHRNDVNAVCFADKTSPHILYSGSDDSTLKVWDRRSMGDGTPVGVFVGHTQGLTYIDSKGDGRYVLSNGKDQMMKLWDLRKMYSSEEFEKQDATYRRGIPNFDYRRGVYPDEEYIPDPSDCSVVTFRGHRVLKTLIRCHFSPADSTNSRYVYSGSSDGGVHIYNLDGTLAKMIDVRAGTKNTRPKGRTYSRYSNYYNDEDRWQTCVRDASWHPNAPIIAAISFNGWGSMNGTCSVHSWNDAADIDDDEPGHGDRVDVTLERRREFYGDDAPGFFDDDD